MSEDSDSDLDSSPTDELPVLSELDVVDLDSSSVMLLSADASPTGRYAAPGSLPDVDPIPDADVGVPSDLAALEARVADQDAEIASLSERLAATRAAVERRDETERALRAQLAEETTQRHELERQLHETATLATDYAARLSELTSRLRTLEQSHSERDGVIGELEAELVAREAQVVARERALSELAASMRAAGAEIADYDFAASEALGSTYAGTPVDDAAIGAAAAASASSHAAPADNAAAGSTRADAVFAASAEAGDAGDGSALVDSREEAAALSAYIECRRAHWLALEAQVDEYRRRLRELEQEIRQRSERERQEAERADAEAARAEALKAELANAAALEARTAKPGRPAMPPPAAEPPTETMRLTAAALLGDAPGEPHPTTRRKNASLLCLTSDPPREYRLSARATVIGRAPQCGIRIATHFVSREHARVLYEREEVLIEDLGSKNGVFVNAVRVARGVLQHGDLVTIGEAQFRFELPETTAAADA